MQFPEGWTVRHREVRDPRPADLVDSRTVPMGAMAHRVAELEHPNGIFTHQAEAIRAIGTGADVCLATGTSSGKSLAFNLAALGVLEREPDALIVAVYPLKALANDQVARWQRTLTTAGLQGTAVRIDGTVKIPERIPLLSTASVVCLTPDIIHAWWLGRLDDPSIKAQLGRVRLLIIDEVHSYTGVLGSNAAYLFRRFDHACRMLGTRIQYFAASATIQDGDVRMTRLFGRTFTVVGPERDGSARFKVDTVLLDPPPGADALQSATQLLDHLHTAVGARVLLFADSRKQVEHIAEILGRGLGAENTSISDRWFLPYRAGYEDSDRRAIEARLSDESLRVIISTSALELGLDIRNLDAVVILGVPQSAMSMQQRSGRVGRHRDGTVLIVNSGSAADNALFQDPGKVLARPFPEAALYLDNRNVQYIHALCLARRGGEHDQIAGTAAAEGESAITSSVNFPQGFLDLCLSERTGQIPRDLEDLSAIAGDRPQVQFPIRSNERQFSIQLGFSGSTRTIGDLTHSQLLREAYPGALYRHQGFTYRVLLVKHDTQVVVVRREGGATTSPVNVPSQLYPNFADAGRTRIVRWGDLTVIEAPLHVIDHVSGFQVRTSHKKVFSYPLSGAELGVRYPDRFFSRRFWTTGVMLAFPGIDQRPRQADIADVLLDAFLLTYPVERQDVSAGAGTLKVSAGGLPSGSRFLSVFDQTYGSLSITSRLFDAEILSKTLELAAVIGQSPDGTRTALESESIELLSTMAAQLSTTPVEVMRPAGVAAESTGGNVLLAPVLNTTVWSTISVTRRIVVRRVFYSPNGLIVSGTFEDQAADGQVHSLPLRNIEFIPGETFMAPFDAEMGDFVGSPTVFGSLL